MKRRKIERTYKPSDQEILRWAANNFEPPHHKDPDPAGWVLEYCTLTRVLSALVRLQLKGKR